MRYKDVETGREYRVITTAKMLGTCTVRWLDDNTTDSEFRWLRHLENVDAGLKA